MLAICTAYYWILVLTLLCFPQGFAESGVETDEQSACLHDAQGRGIPFHSMKDVEVHLLDQSGKLVVLRESVAISPTRDPTHSLLWQIVTSRLGDQSR